MITIPEIQLKGSEKQVAWATEVRNNYIELLKPLLDRLQKGVDFARANGKSEETIAEGIALFQSKVDKTFSQTRASWWIDCRSYAIEGLINRVLTAK